MVYTNNQGEAIRQTHQETKEMNLKEAQAKVNELLSNPEIALQKILEFAPEKFDGEVVYTNKSTAISAIMHGLRADTPEQKAANLIAFAESL